MTRELYRWCAAIIIIFFAGGLGMASYLSRMPHVRDVLGASTGELSLLIVALSVGSMTGMLAAGHIDAWLGARRSMLLFSAVQQSGLIVAALGTSAGSYAGVATGMAMFGAGTGVVDVVMNVSAAAAEQARGRTIMPVFHAMFSLGTLAGAGIGSLAERYGVS